MKINVSTNERTDYPEAESIRIRIASRILAISAIRAAAKQAGAEETDFKIKTD